MPALHSIINILESAGVAAAAEGEAAAPTGGSPMSMIVLLGGMFLILYFIMIRPQMKEQKRRKQMLASIKKHDPVITTGGIYGVVVSVTDTEVTLKVDDSNNVRIKFSRSAVATILREESGETK